MRDLIVTENFTLDGVIEATERWFAPAGDEGVDESDVIAALTEQREAPDAFLVGRTTVLRGPLTDGIQALKSAPRRR